jgi:F0F1-type ATP synthase assembly protein I
LCDLESEGKVQNRIQKNIEDTPISASGDNLSSKTNYALAARISNIGFEMVVPAVVGVCLDRLFDTVVLFAILGTVAGVLLGFWQLVKIAQKN